MKYIKYLLLILLFTGCDFADCFTKCLVCDETPPPEPDITDLAFSIQAIECGGAEELTAEYLTGYFPHYNCEGQPINWYKFAKDSPLPGSGSVKFYDTTSEDITNKIGYFTPVFDGKITGYESYVTEIIEMGPDSFHYVHPQVKPDWICYQGPATISTGASSSTSIECEGWAIIGQPIYFTYED